MGPEKVEMRPAYEWTCPECGRDSFERAMIVEMTEEDARHMIAEHGGDPDDWQTGRWMTRPDEVTCPHCEKQFETEDVPLPGDE